MINMSIVTNKMNNNLSPELVEHKKDLKYDIGNPAFGLGHAHKYGGGKTVNVLPTLPMLVIGPPTAMQIYTNDKTTYIWSTKHCNET